MSATQARSTAGPDVARERDGHAWLNVVRAVAADRTNRLVFAAVALIAAFVYSIVLPFAFSQRISLANWRYLDARYVAFSVGFALVIAWLVTLQVHAVRRIALAARREHTPSASGPLAAASGLASVLPSLLCCSPILPTLVGLVGLSAGARLSTTVALQNFFATNENPILGGALLLMSATAAWSTRKVAHAACLTDLCSVTPQHRDWGTEP